ncbi:peptidylprolyl isomerase [Mangrovimonas aestuarii]|uniref:peptidylprolyl isomerase n=1 Tax=Mangrovimonas aestuarii TaxID=3018443 RepID=UPI002379D03F|nr:peptidylprolyl isomerase [Mangrovimonas aestuarii]
MAVLNKIRQRSVFLIAIIALALFSFILMDLFKNTDAFAAKSHNIVATINGKDISREDFLRKVEAMQRQLGPSATSTQAMNRVWDQEVREAVMQTQYDELGFSVEKDQMRDILKNALSNNPDFQNEAGLFDENKMNEYIANLKETSAISYQQWIDYENRLAVNGLQQDYYNMVKAGMTGTLAEGELEHKLEGDKVDIRYVQVPYATIADTTVEVSKAEITNYINAHAKQFEVEESRDIQFVEFKETPSVEDENAIKDELAAMLKDRVEFNETTKTNDTISAFGKVTDNAEFINTNSDIKFNDAFVFKSDLPTAVADDIYNLNEGEVFGPYKDAGYFKITKMIAVKQLPDSVKARHILIPFAGANGAGPDVIQTEAEAQKTADSVLAVVKADSSKFEGLVKELSSDQGSVENGGRYDWFTYNTMVPEFRDFCFEGKTGDMGVVKTVFGFHIIEIEGQKDTQKAVKVGTIAREIEASEATIDKVFRDASKFEVAIADKNFEEVAKEGNYTVRPVKGIEVLQENIPGLNSQRQIVRWAFNEETTVGDNKRFNIPGGYVIAQLTAKNEAGLMSVEEASAAAIPAIRKEKKADIIKNRISATTLDALASAEGQNVRSASAINMKNPTISGAGKEPLVVGTAFGLKEGQTSGLIAGEKGVYMVETIKITPAVKLENYQSFANQVGQRKMNSVNTKLYNALKDAAEIDDNRAKTVQ